MKSLTASAEASASGRAGSAAAPAGARRRLEDVEALQHQDVGALDHDGAPGHDVVDGVGVHRRLDPLDPRLDRRDEVEQGPPVVGLREALAGAEPALLQHRVGQQEAVGGHQRDPWGLGEAGQQVGDEAGRRRLAHRHRAGHGDHEGRRVRADPQEVRDASGPLASGGDVVLQQRRQRPVDDVDLRQVDRVPQAPQLLDIGLGQGQGSGRGERAPLVAAELDVRGGGGAHRPSVTHPCGRRAACGRRASRNAAGLT